MTRQAPKGPFCQSCSMPLEKAEDFGTDVAGFRVNDYCRHCFVNGEFTDPEITMEAMRDRCVGIMAAQGRNIAEWRYGDFWSGTVTLANERTFTGDSKISHS